MDTAKVNELTSLLECGLLTLTGIIIFIRYICMICHCEQHQMDVVCYSTSQSFYFNNN